MSYLGTVIIKMYHLAVNYVFPPQLEICFKVLSNSHNTSGWDASIITF